MKIKFRGDEKTFSTDYSIEIYDDNDGGFMKIKFIEDEKTFSTDYSIEIHDDDDRQLFDVFLTHDGWLKVYGIDRYSSKLSIEPKAENFVILKLDR